MWFFTANAKQTEQKTTISPKLYNKLFIVERAFFFFNFYYDDDC